MGAKREKEHAKKHTNENGICKSTLVIAINM